MIRILLLFSALSFLFFGLACLFDPRLKDEFDRYGLPRYRKLTGVLQLLGATGILVGYWEVSLQIFSTLGLSCLMLLGVGVRIRIKDTFIQTLPAVFYFFLNTYLSLRLLDIGI